MRAIAAALFLLSAAAAETEAGWPACAAIPTNSAPAAAPGAAFPPLAGGAGGQSDYLLRQIVSELQSLRSAVENLESAVYSVKGGYSSSGGSDLDDVVDAINRLRRESQRSGGSDLDDVVDAINRLRREIR